ncbi:MAG: GNAT family N-acetyltransferase [Promethearchaeota archaeon]
MQLQKGYSVKVDDHFSIHIATDSEEELKAIVNFNMKVHQNEILRTYIPSIFLEHPRKSEILWLFIKDDRENKIVSSLCLSPLEWQIGGTTLPVCEMEFVGTLQEYRGKGFIKKLNNLYENIMAQNNYILSVIKGIPYFYRKLGYEYVSSLDERIAIPVSKIPNKNYKNINFRKAKKSDIPFIKRKYNQFYENFYIFNKFDSECFKFMYLKDIFNSEIRSTYIFEESDAASNYFSLGMSYDDQCYEIICPDLTKDEMISLLQFIKTMGNYTNDDIITLSISEHSSLYRFIKNLGGIHISTYGWQAKIPNLEAFFNLIKEIIEKRVQHSEFKGLTKTMRFSNYHKTIILDFVNGKIQKIKSEKEHPNPDITDLMIPGTFFLKLILGDRTFNETNYIVKDAIIKSSSKSLIEILFPKKISFLSSYL